MSVLMRFYRLLFLIQQNSQTCHRNLADEKRIILTISAFKIRTIIVGTKNLIDNAFEPYIKGFNRILIILIEQRIILGLLIRSGII